jgi:hypothetical protein
MAPDGHLFTPEKLLDGLTWIKLHPDDARELFGWGGRLKSTSREALRFGNDLLAIQSKAMESLRRTPESEVAAVTEFFEASFDAYASTLLQSSKNQGEYSVALIQLPAWLIWDAVQGADLVIQQTVFTGEAEGFLGRAEQRYNLSALFRERFYAWLGQGESLPHAGPAEITENQASSLDAREKVKAERTASLNAYKDEVKQQLGFRLTDEGVAKAARPTWHERTPVLRWKRADPRSTDGDDAAIRRVLQEKPHLKNPVIHTGTS